MEKKCDISTAETIAIFNEPIQLSHVQYCVNVMQTIIDECCDNHDLSAIFERQLA